MNRCDQEKRLTPFLLGDLSEREEAEFSRHLAGCAACQECARELSPVLQSLADGLAKDGTQAPRFDLHHQLELLSVPAESTHRVLDWMARSRPWLVAAACAVAVTGLSYFFLCSFDVVRAARYNPHVVTVQSAACELVPACPVEGVARLPESGENSSHDEDGTFGLVSEAREAAAHLPLARCQEDNKETVSDSLSMAEPDVMAGAVADLGAETPVDAGVTIERELGREYAKLDDKAKVVASSASHVRMPGAYAGRTTGGRARAMLEYDGAGGGAAGGEKSAVASSSGRPSSMTTARSDIDVKGLAAEKTPKRLTPLRKAINTVVATYDEVNAPAASPQPETKNMEASAAEVRGENRPAKQAKEALGPMGEGFSVAADPTSGRTSAGWNWSEKGKDTGINEWADAEQKRARAQALGDLRKDTLVEESLRGTEKDVEGLDGSGTYGLLIVGGMVHGETASTASEKVPAPTAAPFLPASDTTEMAANKPLDASCDKPRPDVQAVQAVNAVGFRTPTRNGLAPAGGPEMAAPPAEPAAPKPPRAKASAFSPFVATSENHFSTFAIDVNTASYNLTRQAVRSGALPDPDTVRTEEILNAFDYGDAAPDRATFRVYVEGAPSAFGAPGLTLLRIGVKGKRLGREEQRPAMLTFLIDTSGSMAQPDRMGRARMALRLLLDQLAPVDKLQIISFDDKARVVLPPTPAARKKEILKAFDRLQCNGSTNLEDGMRRAFQQAARAFVPGGENRVILISDGVANLGADNAQDILREVEAFRKQGVTCSVFGVGEGTYNDAMLEELANKGQGVYRFLDSDDEVKRVFVDDLAATLHNIATDVKIQVEWSAEAVRRFRQLGYERRALTTEQFRDDTVAAGEVGSGQAVTALYELDLTPAAKQASLGTVRVRYRRVDTGATEEIAQEITPDMIAPALNGTRPQFRLAAGAAAFAELLRGSPYVVREYTDVANLLRPVTQEFSLDPRVKELLSLVEAAETMSK